MRLRTSPLYAPEITMGPDGYRPAPGGQPISLLAPPGTYTVKLTVEGKDYTQTLKVLKDPHSNGTECDIQIQTKLLPSLSGTTNNMVDAVNLIESLRAQVADLEFAGAAHLLDLALVGAEALRIGGSLGADDDAGRPLGKPGKRRLRRVDDDRHLPATQPDARVSVIGQFHC